MTTARMRAKAANRPNPKPASPEVAEEDLADLAAAVTAADPGRPPTSVAGARLYADRGWTPATVQALRDLASWSVAADTAIAGGATDWAGTADTHEGAIYRGLSAALFYLPSDYPTVTATAGLPWVALLAAAPNRQEMDALYLLFDGDEPRLRRDFERWLTFGRVGPLAYAAGVPLTETRTAAMQDEGLAVLAALRGWSVPPLLIAGI